MSEGLVIMSYLAPYPLQRRLADKYDEEWMGELKQRTWFHKLTYWISEETKWKGAF